MNRLTVSAGRLLSAAGLLVLVALLPWLSGTDPARTVLRSRYTDLEATPEALADIRAQLGLADGPFVLAGRWFGGLLRGDPGTSWVSGRPVEVLPAFGVSLSLMFYALLIAVPVAVLLSARTLYLGSHRRLFKARTGAVAAALAALPEFLVASVLATVVAVQLGWFPASGWDGPSYAVLPALAMGLPAGAVLGRLFDDALPGVFAEPWAKTQAAYGIPARRTALHAVRRVLPTLLPQLGLVAVGLTGGAVAVETLFAVPGLGNLALSAALAQDLPVLQAAALVLIVLGLLAGVLARLSRRLVLGRTLADSALPAPARLSLTAGRGAYVLTFVLLVVLVATVALGMLRDPLAVDTSSRLAGPSWARPFGSDALGRDVLARIGHGALETIAVAVAVSAVALVIGVLVGLLPRLSTGLVETSNALPPVLAGLLVAGATGRGAFGAAAAVAAVGWSRLAAHTSSLYEQEWAAPHVTSAQALGASRLHVLRRHVLPGVLPPVTRHAVLRIPANALAIASLSFLGLGTAPPDPEWGRLLSENMPYAERAPWAVLAPAGALMVLGVLSVALSVVSGTSRRVRHHPGTPSESAAAAT